MLPAPNTTRSLPSCNQCRHNREKKCQVTLSAVGVFTLLGVLMGGIYLGTTPWGQALIEKIKAALAGPLTVQGLLAIVLIPVGICGVICAIPCITRRINICLAKPIMIDQTEEFSDDNEDSPVEQESLDDAAVWAGEPREDPPNEYGMLWPEESYGFLCESETESDTSI